MPSVYYNENDPYPAEWLRNLIAAGHLLEGDVDERSIIDVRPDDLRGYGQCHFFAGIGGWPLALRLAGAEHIENLWTGSCPCQPLSVAGQHKGHADERHLWPAFYGLIAERKPAIVFGEQVAGKLGREWLAGVRLDLEAAGYACGAADLPACSVGAPHKRNRLWFMANADNCQTEHLRVDSGRASSTKREVSSGCSDVANSDSERLEGIGSDDNQEGRQGPDIRPAGLCDGTGWVGSIWLTGADGKARRVGTDFRKLGDGLRAGMAGLRARPETATPFQEAESEVIRYGQETSTKPADVLRAVWGRVLSQPTPYETMGEQAGICQAEILLTFLCELHRRGGKADVPFSSEKAFAAAVRSVRKQTGSARTSHRRRHHEQQSSEHSDALQALSWILAQHAQEAWAIYRSENAAPMALLQRNIPARVGKLRAFGNAIVPQLAAEFIRAALVERPS